jgi:hypothetical protein
MILELLPTAIVALLLVVWLSRWSEKRSKAVQDAHSAAFEKRLRTPDLAAVERHFGHALPQSLYALYADQDLVLSHDIVIEVPNLAEGEECCYIAWIEPGDLENVTSPYSGCEGFFAIGDNGAGDQFLVNPREADPEVFYHFHETGEFFGLGVTLSDFLKAPRFYPDDE